MSRIYDTSVRELGFVSKVAFRVRGGWRSSASSPRKVESVGVLRSTTATRFRVLRQSLVLFRGIQMAMRRFILTVLFASSTALTGMAEVTPTRHSMVDPQRIAAEALHAGLNGDWAARDSGLTRALELSPGDSLARGHKGFLRYGKTWVHYDQLNELLPVRQILTVYEEQREGSEDNVASHLRLANWCRKHRLPQQELAHLSRVVQLDSNHSTARERLGYRFVNGQWISKSELWQAALRTREARRAFQEWQPKLKKLLSALDSRNEEQWWNAKEKLLAIREPEAIPAIEAVLLPSASRHASLALSAIDRIPHYQASLALARHAVVTSHESLRRQATRYLASRPQDDYVPALLDTLKNPTLAKAAIDFVDGRLYYRHVLYQESRDQKDLAIMDTRYAQQPTLNGPAADAASIALTGARVTQASREQARAQYNQALTVLNRRVVGVLAQTTGHTELKRPSDWWSWWDAENGVSYPEKPTRTQYASRNVVIRRQSPAPPPCECFAAGTIVWTATGPKPIEKIRIGDLVLSQDVETGEVGLKPVLTTTTRPPEQLVRITTEREVLEATEGHPLWEPKTGWTLAGKLTAATPLYALDKSVEIREITEGGHRETYNLVVADYHTYFVGESRILSHDNTRRRPTSVLLPGLKRVSERSEAASEFGP